MISRCVSPFVPPCLSCLVLSSQIFIVFMSRGFCHCRVIYGPWESRRSRWLKVHHVRNPHSHHFPDAAGVDDDNLTLDRTTYLEPHILMEAKLQGIKFDVRSLVFCPKSFSYSHLFICQKISFLPVLVLILYENKLQVSWHINLHLLTGRRYSSWWFIFGNSVGCSSRLALHFVLLIFEKQVYLYMICAFIRKWIQSDRWWGWKLTGSKMNLQLELLVCHFHANILTSVYFSKLACKCIF